MAVRPGLKWLLGAAVLLSLIAIVAGPSPGPNASVALGNPSSPGSSWTDSSRSERNLASPLRMVPTKIDRIPIEISEQDPFNPFPPPPPPEPVQPPPPALIAPIEPTPEEAPQPPPMAHRFFGSMRNPDGQLMTYVTDGASTVQAMPGVTLSSGYVIDAITEREVKLIYPPLSYESRISIPPAPNP